MAVITTDKAEYPSSEVSEDAQVLEQALKMSVIPLSASRTAMDSDQRGYISADYGCALGGVK